MNISLSLSMRRTKPVIRHQFCAMLATTRSLKSQTITMAIKAAERALVTRDWDVISEGGESLCANARALSNVP